MYWAASLMTSSERARSRLLLRQYVDYGYEVPDNMLAILLGLAFCVVSPLIAPIALLYFLVNNIIGRYTLVYVYSERFQSGGKVGSSTLNHGSLTLNDARNSGDVSEIF
jgi:hypothetical protein